MRVMVMGKRGEGGLTPGTRDDQASPRGPRISATDPDEPCYPDSLAILNVLGIRPWIPSWRRCRRSRGWGRCGSGRCQPWPSLTLANVTPRLACGLDAQDMEKGRASLQKGLPDPGRGPGAGTESLALRSALGSAPAEVEPAFRDVEHLGSTRCPAWVLTYETPSDSANTFLHGAASYRLLWLVYPRCLSRTVSPAPDPSFLEGLVGGQRQHSHLLLLCL